RGAATVAATARIAAGAGVSVFATGGIGGVHRGTPPDVSADLIELSRTPLVVVCAGAKSILDIPATRELLETLGVLVLGWRTDRFPAFYTTDGGVGVDARVESASEVAEVWRAHRRTSAEGAILLCAPIPPRDALDEEVVDGAIQLALRAAAESRTSGKAITPFLLAAVADATGGASLEANVALLYNNATIAAEVAVAIADQHGR
ncbi:MAG: pseudouridine-5'-phosphate glycosidase, partial [Gemmatimonadota bacterium]